MTWFILIAFFTIFAVVLGKLVYETSSGKYPKFNNKNDETANNMFFFYQRWLSD